MEPEAVTTVDPAPVPPGSPPRPQRPAEAPTEPILRRREKPKHEKPKDRRDPKPKLDKAATEPVKKRKGRRRRKGRVEARRVQRIIRHVDPWSVLKFSLLLYFSLFLIVLSAGVLLWLAASATDVVTGVEDFIEELFGFETFAFEPGQILTASVLGGLVLVVAGTAANVVFAVLFNLISDVVGGLRLTVIEEERVRPVRREEAP
jgi:hypothetical protein